MNEQGNARAIIDENNKTVSGSFLGDLQLDGVWDHQKFFALYDAINRLSSELERSERLNYCRAVNFISSSVLSNLIFHYDPNDAFYISNSNSVEIDKYLNRLILVVRGFFTGKTVHESMFHDQLRQGKG